MTKKGLSFQNIGIINSYEIDYIIQYVAISSFHIIVCILSISFFTRRIKKDKTNIKLSYLNLGRLLVIFSLPIILLLIDYFQPNVSLLSHERIYVILKHTPFFNNLFNSFPNDYISFLNFDLFYVFSLLPFSLIVLGITVMISSCFSIGVEIAKVKNVEKENDWKQMAKILKDTSDSLKNHVFLLSIVLVSSTIATIIFFYLPLPAIPEFLRDSYKSVSLAMGFFWGVTYSLTLLSIYIFPYKYLAKKTSEFSQNEKLKNDLSFKKWLNENQEIFVLSENIKIIVSVLSPIFASLLGNLF